MTVHPEETVLFVYAVVPADHAVPTDAKGVDDNPLEVVQQGPIAAVFSEMTAIRPPGRRADLTAYSAVVEALVPGGAVAPMRFGTVVPDRDVLVNEVLAPRADELAAVL